MGWMKEWGFPPLWLFMLKSWAWLRGKKSLQKGNLQTYKSRRALGEKGESCEPGCPYKKVAKIDLWIYNFWKSIPWMTYNFEIMKKVVTLQNGIGLWSQKLVLKPKAFCKSPKCQKPLLFVKVFRVPAFCTYNKRGATSHGQFYRGFTYHFTRFCRAQTAGKLAIRTNVVTGKSNPIPA